MARCSYVCKPLQEQSIAKKMRSRSRRLWLRLLGWDQGKKFSSRFGNMDIFRFFTRTEIFSVHILGDTWLTKISEVWLRLVQPFWSLAPKPPTRLACTAGRRHSLKMIRVIPGNVGRKGVGPSKGSKKCMFPKDSRVRLRASLGLGRVSDATWLNLA